MTEHGEQVAWPGTMENARHVVEHPIGDSVPVIERRWASSWTAVSA